MSVQFFDDLVTALIATSDAQPKRRRQAAGPRATRAELDAAIAKACERECTKTQAARGFTITPRRPSERPYPGARISLSLTYGRPTIVRVTVHPEAGKPAVARRVSYAAAITFLGDLVADAEERRPDSRPESCYCAVAGEMAPCSWCESLRECEECGDLAPEGDMDDHIFGQHPDAESAARVDWQQQVERHSAALVQAAADEVDREIRVVRGLRPQDFEALGANGRIWWYRAAARALVAACGEC